MLYSTVPRFIYLYLYIMFVFLWFAFYTFIYHISLFVLYLSVRLLFATRPQAAGKRGKLRGMPTGGAGTATGGTFARAFVETVKKVAATTTQRRHATKCVSIVELGLVGLYVSLSISISVNVYTYIYIYIQI